MNDLLKLINKWLVIFALLFLVIFAVNKFTSWRYEVKGDIVIDTIKNEVLHIRQDGKISYVR